MSLSTPNRLFLLDENVRQDLYKFLRSEGFNVKIAIKGSQDLLLCSISKKEKRIIVTNDIDFQYFTDQQVFSVILLTIPQYEGKVLIRSFTKLLSEFNNFPGRLVVLKPDSWDDFPLFKKIDEGIYQREFD